MKKNERLLIVSLGHDIIIFDSLDLEELQELLDHLHYYVNLEDKGNWDTELKWYGEETIYYYYINDLGNIVLTDLIAREEDMGD